MPITTGKTALHLNEQLPLVRKVRFLRLWRQLFLNKDNGNGNERTNEISGIPRILGDEGKSKEVSSVFAAILRRGYDTRDEIQGTVQNHWLASLEQLAKEQGS